ncbi:hypothetical protein PLICRDRAFT_44059 [Plicaturopsis crispa FD-325 SS-3]|nr:hypothetical protein PLICRDRAFT_44059 [Plicaturopsis crispa FD-325 SS-3]
MRTDDSAHSVPVKDGAPAYLHTGLDSALRRLSNPPLSEGPFTEKPVHRRFIIGGASLYSETLAFSLSSHSPSPAFVDRVLLTRILSPSFEDCDVFMPDFLAETAVSSDERTEVRWQRSTHERLNEWVGFEVPQGVQEEKGVRYEFQMWVR